MQRCMRNFFVKRPPELSGKPVAVTGSHTVSFKMKKGPVNSMSCGLVVYEEWCKKRGHKMRQFHLSPRLLYPPPQAWGKLEGKGDYPKPKREEIVTSPTNTWAHQSRL